MFGESANLNNFAQQAAAMNIQPTTLSLLFSIALYASSRSWDNFATRAYTRFGDMGDSESKCPSAEDEFGSTYISTPKTTPKPVHVTPPILPDVEMTPVDHTVTPETSRKKDKQKARVTADKQIIHQSFTANPEAQTPDKQNTLFLGAKTTAPEVTHILTGYKESDDEQEQVRDIIVYDIPYTWDVDKILGELTLWGKTIKLSLKRQHKYQTLRVKIVLNSFTLPQFTKFWTTDLGGIPVRWFPASWTLRERNNRCAVLARLKLYKQVKKAPTKQKAKNVPDKKPRKTAQQSGNVNLKKKDQKSSTSAKKQANSTKDPLKDPKSQKLKSNKKSRNKGGNKDNTVVLAEILSLLQKLV
ncbi:hypothetical protein RirG_062150 [Rhizophagus irregularis DAOM 197198w]|nr:hypothetical protein RirG_062150 [Rhizophagus irregularis DAOM 197198w]